MTVIWTTAGRGDRLAAWTVQVPALILALFAEETNAAWDRQRGMYAEDLPLWQRYERACDTSRTTSAPAMCGYCRRWSPQTGRIPELSAACRDLLGGWCRLLAEVARATERRHRPIGPFSAEELATLVASAFFGAEALQLLGFDREALPIRSALRRIGVLIKELERRGTSHPDTPQ